MGIAGEWSAEALDEAGIAETQFGSLADARARGMGVKRETATGNAEFVAFGAQAGLNFLPGLGIGEVFCEARPQGSDDPLFRPVGRPRSVVALDFLCDQIAQYLTNGHVALARDGDNLM